MIGQPLWQAEKLVDLSLATELVEAAFPELAPVLVALLGEGWDNIAYLVNERYVFRFPRRTMAVPLLRIEHKLLGWISQNVQLAVPNPIFYAEGGNGYDWPFSGYSMIPGATACGVRLSPAERVAMAEPLGRFLRALHDLPVSHAFQLGAESDKIGKLDISLRLAKTARWLDQLEPKRLLSPAQRKMLENAMEPCRDLVVPAVSCLVHGDLYARHLLVDGGQLSGVIDWGDLSIGHPAIDLAIIYSFFDEEGRQNFQSAYGAIDSTTRALSRFRAVSHTAALLAYASETGDDNLLAAAMFAVDGISH